MSSPQLVPLNPGLEKLPMTEVATDWTDKDYADLAATEWEAWQGSAEDSDLVPDAREYGSTFAPRLRLALLVMHQSKGDLVEMARKLVGEPASDPEHPDMFQQFYEELMCARSFAEGMHALADAATARCLAAMAAVAAPKEPDGKAR